MGVCPQSCGLRPHTHRTLPRAKKVSPGHFFALLRKAALFESYIWNPIPKKEGHPCGCPSFLVDDIGLDPMI